MGWGWGRRGGGDVSLLVGMCRRVLYINIFCLNRTAEVRGESEVSKIPTHDG